MWTWFKEKGFKYMGIAILGYCAHLLLEAFIITNILALFNISIPVLV